MIHGSIVVTGAAGFIGSRILHTLSKDRAYTGKLLAVDHLDAYQHRQCTQLFRSTIPCVDMSSFLKELGTIKPSLVIHMGASSSTDETRKDFLDQVNVNYSVSLWNYCTQEQIPFVYASSAATYGDGELGFSDEPSLIPNLKPLNLYGQSKQDFDLYVLQQEKTTQTPPIWAGLKYFNVYGPGEWHKGNQASVVMHARNQILNTGMLKLFKSHKAGIADGYQKRDFVYVDDVVDITLKFAQGKLKSGIYNAGSGEARTFLDLANSCFSALGKTPQIQFVDTPERYREHYQYYTCANLSRLRSVAGYVSPMTSLEEGTKAYFKEWKTE